MIPIIISWNVTKKCNLFCDHCYRESGKEQDKGELSTQEGKKLIDQIAQAGFKILILSGGEPLTRLDIEDLATYAKQQGLRPVLGTNGTLLTREKAWSLKYAGISGAAVSIDYLHEEEHDAFRKVKGSFKKAMEGIKHCLEAGIRVQINTTVTKKNKDQLMQITDLAQQIGARAHHPFFLVEVGRGKELKKEALEDEEYMDMIHQILEKKREVNIEIKPTCAPQFLAMAEGKGISMRFSRGCLAGVGYCCIIPNGDVHICPYLPVKVGNVRETPFHILWEDSTIFRTLRDYSQYKGNCGNCGYIDKCGGCRARAYGLTGDFMEEDPVSALCQTYYPKVYGKETI